MSEHINPRAADLLTECLVIYLSSVESWIYCHDPYLTVLYKGILFSFIRYGKLIMKYSVTIDKLPLYGTMILLFLLIIGLLITTINKKAYTYM